MDEGAAQVEATVAEQDVPARPRRGRWRRLRGTALVLIAMVAVSLAVASAEEWTASVVLLQSLAVAASALIAARAERLLGTLRVLVLAVVGAGVGTGVTAALTVPLSLAGEALAFDAAYESFWAPFAVGAALLGGAAHGLASPWRHAVPMAVAMTCASTFLFGGHVSAVICLAAVGAGSVLGRFLVAASRVEEWRDDVAARARTTMSILLAALALGIVLGLQPGSYGLLVPVALALGPVFAPFTAAVLVVAAFLLLRGRRLGLVVAAAVLAVLVAAVAWRFTVEPLREDWFDWRGQTVFGLEWQILLLLLWLPPAIVLLLLLRRRAAFARGTRTSVRVIERERIRSVLAQADGGSLGYMSTWDGNDVWFGADGRSAVAYRASNGIALTVSDPIAPTGEAAETIRAFAEFCSSRALTPVFYSVHDEHAPVFAALGWRTTQVAEEAVLPLGAFSTSGKRRQDLRTAVNRAAREGVLAHWSTFAGLDPALREQVVDLSREWVSQKELPEMGFTLGGLPEMDDPGVRLLLAVDGSGRLHGVTSWLPVHRSGAVVGCTLDVMRRGESPMPGVMEFLIATAAFAFQDEGLEVLSLSGSPLAGMRVGDDASRSARLMDRGTDLLRRVLEPVYGFTSLHRFKDKFQPEHRALLMAYPSAIELPAIGRALVKAYVPSLRFRQALAFLQHARGGERTAEERP